MRTMTLIIVLLAAGLVACSGDQKKETPADVPFVDCTGCGGDLVDAVADVPDGVADLLPDVPLPDAVEETVAEVAAEILPDVPEIPWVEVPESVVDEAEPTCVDCFILLHDTWDGSWEPSVPNQGVYEYPVPDGQGNELTAYLRPWMRMRMTHPGTVKRLLLYTAGGTGELEVQLSTGFPGGHYPCLDENSGDDLYPVGKPFRVAISEAPGWREIDVSSLGHGLLGYDEFFILWQHVDEARVALSLPTPVFQGDYSIYGGLIGDGPGDQMTCFPTMSTFTDADENPLVWLVRAEIEASQVVEEHTFTDVDDAGPKIGGHVSFQDFDRDGDVDFLTGGALWANDGTGAFEQVSGAGLEGLGGETVWGDFDNDGFSDILGVGGLGYLFKNNGDGTFTNLTETAGLNLDANSQGVVWVDIDADGLLDFYSASYGTQADPEKAYRDYVYINNGDGTFTDMTAELGVPVKPIYYHGRGVGAADYDGDGDIDIYVGNYRLDPNQLWQNKGGLKGFVDVAMDAGVKGNFVQGAYGHGIGPGWADLDGDGWFDLVNPNLAHPRFWTFSDPTQIFLNNQDGTFTELASTPFTVPESGILYDETHSDSTLFDFDNDGDIDLFLTSVYEGRRSYLMANDGSSHFIDETYKAGIRHFNGWGAAAADVDNDGDMDLLANRLFRNENTGYGSLRVRLEGGATPEEHAGWSNRDAIGAVAVLDVGGKKLVRQVEGGTGVGCQNDFVLHFGLGAAGKADKLTVFWPSGKESIVTGNLDAGKLVVVGEKEL